jgi:thimet oligopeptidase
MWSLVIAKDLLSKFEEGGMLNVDVARSYRMAILEPGGSADAAELVRNFLDRPYSFEAFAKWLSR